jgi:hypothetical protein
LQAIRLGKLAATKTVIDVESASTPAPA